MLRPSITVVDRLVLRWVVRRLPRRLGPLLTGLGEAATGGGLWLAAAGLLCARGRRGRRGAASGLAAYAVASSLANGPMKWVVRRPRPHGAALVGLRRRGRSPGTSSFPSSHSAAAVAFAVAASAELPPATLILLPAAAAVALSRLRALRHYPSDVVAGVVLGVAVGSATTWASRTWSQRRRRPEPDPRAGSPDGLPSPPGTIPG